MYGRAISIGGIQNFKIKYSYWTTYFPSSELGKGFTVTLLEKQEVIKEIRVRFMPPRMLLNVF
jgi:hypothetical protein